MAVAGNIIIVQRPNIPPTFLGTTTVVVKIGETVSITRGMLENTVPPYQHPVDNPKPEIGGIMISGFLGSDYREFLSSSNVTQTFGVLTNNGSRIYTNGSGSYTNNQITRANLNAGNFKIQGVKIGQGYIKYKAKAWDTVNSVESAYSVTEGLIKIEVVNNTNSGPSNVDDGATICELNNSTILDSDFFTTNFTDPDGDAPNQVRIDSLPSASKGFLYYLGMQVQASQLPLFIDVDTLDFSVLTFSATGPTATIGDIVTFNWTISDKGSGKFY